MNDSPATRMITAAGWIDAEVAEAVAGRHAEPLGEEYLGLELGG